jgi:hypothetical protein
MRLFTAIAFLCLTGPGMAADHHHPPADAAIHDKFYSTWERPDQPGVSCCNKQDCAPAEARMIGGKWHARHVGQAEWLPIPDAKIERRRDSPDGRNHLCAMSGLVFCFIAGAGI